MDFDSTGHLNLRVLQKLNVPSDGDFYICGPASFMSDLTGGLAALGVAADHIHTELFGAGPAMTPGIAPSPRRSARRIEFHQCQKGVNIPEKRRQATDLMQATRGSG